MSRKCWAFPTRGAPLGFSHLSRLCRWPLLNGYGERREHCMMSAGTKRRLRDMGAGSAVRNTRMHRTDAPLASALLAR